MHNQLPSMLCVPHKPTQASLQRLTMPPRPAMSSTVRTAALSAGGWRLWVAELQRSWFSTSQRFLQQLAPHLLSPGMAVGNCYHSNIPNPDPRLAG